MVLIALLAMGITSYQMGKQTLRRIVQHDLEYSVQAMTEKVILIFRNTDSRDFIRNVGYFLTNQLGDYSQRDLDAVLFYFDENGQLIQDFWYQDFDYVALPEELISKMVSEKSKGYTNLHWMGKDYTLAYQYLYENDWFYVAALEDAQYLAPIDHIRNVMFFIGLGIILLGILVAIFGANLITQPLNKLMKTLIKTTEGDISVRVEVAKTVPEISRLGSSFNRMLSNLTSFFSDLNNAATRLFASGQELSSLSTQSYDLSQNLDVVYQEIVESTETQSNMSVEAHNSLDEVGNQVNNLVKYVQDTSAASRKTYTSAQEGIAVLNNLEDKFYDISKVVNLTADEVMVLHSMAKDITSFVQIIQDMSSHTQLLALNASIEAARAGEMGRGFAVVANEVKALSYKAVEASNEIEKVVKNILVASDRVLQSVKKGETVVNEGQNLMSKTNQVFQDIVETAQNTDQAVTEELASLEEVNVEVEMLIDIIKKLEDHAKETLLNTQQIKDMFNQQKEASSTVKAASIHLGDLAKDMQEFLESYTY